MHRPVHPLCSDLSIFLHRDRAGRGRVATAALGMGENRAVPTTNVEDGETARRTPTRTSRSGHRARETRSPEPDAICVRAVDQARRAAEDVAGSEAVGDHLCARCEGVRLITHFFACRSRGYRGWQWAVTVARASRARGATVCETSLLPGEGAILAPPWVPWAERLAPGDIGPNDVLPYSPEDPLLIPGYQQTTEDDEDRHRIWELGLGRPRVLGLEGRHDTATRWYSGEHGPTAPEALHASAACSTCGYFLPLAGTLRQVFGVCANRWSSSDGRVVSVDHGCGAHSETDVERTGLPPLSEPILDETGIDPFPDPEPAGAGDAASADTAEPASGETTGRNPDGTARTGTAGRTEATDRSVGQEAVGAGKRTR
ncbi:MAG: hypothetical protein QG608_2019 [Actinomycetota bacterium]|nr:hypothetical protein [Actinomycetota bacterium]